LLDKNFPSLLSKSVGLISEKSEANTLLSLDSNSISH